MLTHRELLDLRYDIDKREREERMALLKDHSKKFSLERASLIRSCGEAGHIEGKFHDNGVGCTWMWCSRCGASIPETVQQYKIAWDDDDE